MVLVKILAETKAVTKTSKALIWISIIELGIIVLLLVSGFRKLEPFLLLFSLLVLGGVIYYFMRKPKEYDIFKLISMVQSKAYKEWGYSLDIRDAQVVPVTPELTELYLPHEPLSFRIINNKVRGVQIRHLYKSIKELEKSRLFESSQKYLGAEAKIKQQAENLNIDVESLGLEP